LRGEKRKKVEGINMGIRFTKSLDRYRGRDRERIGRDGGRNVVGNSCLVKRKPSRGLFAVYPPYFQLQVL
jgi:hypothetical protein